MSESMQRIPEGHNPELTPGVQENFPVMDGEVRAESLTQNMQPTMGQNMQPTMGQNMQPTMQPTMGQTMQPSMGQNLPQARQQNIPHTMAQTMPQNLSQTRRQNRVARGSQQAIVPAEDAGWSDYETPMSLGYMQPSYVYALGTVSCRFPNQSLDKEYVQALAHVSDEINTAAMTDRQRFYTVFDYTTEKGRKPYLYIAQEMCWVLSVENIDTYILSPRSEEQLWELVDMLDSPFATPPMDVDVVVGVRGPIAPPDACNGLQLPIVGVSHTYSFPVDRFVNQLPRPENMSESFFQTVATETFYRNMQLADNVGNMDEHRAINYVVLQYPNIYTMTAEQALRNNKLSNVEVKPSPLSGNGARPIMNVIFTYSSTTTTAEEKFYTEVDVTGMYPFLVQSLQPYYGN